MGRKVMIIPVAIIATIALLIAFELPMFDGLISYIFTREALLTNVAWSPVGRFFFLGVLAFLPILLICLMMAKRAEKTAKYEVRGFLKTVTFFVSARCYIAFICYGAIVLGVGNWAVAVDFITGILFAILMFITLVVEIIRTKRAGFDVDIFVSLGALFMVIRIATAIASYQPIVEQVSF